MWSRSLKWFQNLYTTPLFLIFDLDSKSRGDKIKDAAYCLRPLDSGASGERRTVDATAPGAVASSREQGADIAQTFTWTYFFWNFKNTILS